MSWFLDTPLDIKEKWTLDKAYPMGVNVLINYKDYFDLLGQTIDLTEDGDEIFIVGWLFDIHLKLVEERTVIDYLSKANMRNVKIRVLLTGVINGKRNQASVDGINNLKGKGQKIAIIDNQLYFKSTEDYSDHHQKAVFIRRGRIPILFVGGMDIADKDDANPKYNHLSWIDAQAVISGSGALLGLNSLEERWNSVIPSKVPITMPFVNYDTREGDHGFTVQFVRTYPPSKEGNVTISGRNYAHDGDFTYDSLIRNAVKNSRKFIYHEDQFFYSVGQNNKNPSIKKLGNDIKRSDITGGSSLDDLLIAKANQPGFKYLGIGFDFFRLLDKEKKPSEFPKKFHDRKGIKKINMFPHLLTHKLMDTGIEGTNIHKYFHSKLWIFDDELLVIGSANYFNQSFNTLWDQSTSSELGVAITSSKASGAGLGFADLPYIHALRLKLWERIRNILVPSDFKFTPQQVGDFEKEFNIFNETDNNTEKFFIPMI